MSGQTGFVRAFFKVLTGKYAKRQIDVHFNPVSLQYQVQNQMQQRGGGSKQFVSQSTGKLTLDLVFDTTHDGTDVRALTVQVLQLMQPEKKIPPEVVFEWGAYKFEGSVESCKETIDFFSANGVPLRASLNLTMAAKEKTVFEGGSDKKALGVSKGLSATAVEVPSYDPVGPAAPPTPAGSPQDTANRAGSPGAARDLAAANGAESLRFPTGGSLTVPDGIKLGPPVAFASGGGGIGAAAGAGFGIGGGAGIGIGGAAGAGIGIGGGAGIGIGGAAGAGFGASAGAGFGASAGAGFGASAGAGFGASAGAGFGSSASAGFGASAGAGFGAAAGGGFASASAGGFTASAGYSASAGYGAFAGARVSAGGSASAGVTATQGAFAGLSVKRRTSTSWSLDVDRLLPEPGSAHLAAGGGASFAVGGKALVEGSASLRADVGAGASARSRLTFDEW
jgi:Contractile injection system tube protein